MKISVETTRELIIQLYGDSVCVFALLAVETFERVKTPKEDDVAVEIQLVKDVEKWKR